MVVMFAVDASVARKCRRPTLSPFLMLADCVYHRVDGDHCLGAGKKDGQDHLLWAKSVLSFLAEADDFVRSDH